ncbi:competence protein CoiA [Ureibacillus chungkukjangi]|uniref:Competence CoiA-like predicted nuclease n=1 Tax=Ureibacillus chungkukjangi TaxID=1202712 RepID=A0A318TP16_9BACL|nr:competence protein CoiA family protein [Ureibacillus chungkukjangi]PYF06526.1 competence CoiA-like predicted nuclease [Ureibacillus chungkukjangi]
MLVAYTEQNEPFILNSSMPQTTLHQLRSSKKFYCPLCKQQLLFKIGSLKIPHFAHISKSNCDYLFSDRESEIHLKGKEQLYNHFKALSIDTELEAYLPSIQQRPDILLQDQNKKQFAIEFQCSPISQERLIERNEGYASEKISPIWIPNTPSNIVKKGIQKISLTKNHQQFLLSSEHHPYLMTYNPAVRQFFYISNLIFLQGNRFISKVQAIPIDHQKFPFYLPRPLTQNEFKQYLLINNQEKHKYLQDRVLLSRRGVKDILLRSVYELRLNLHALPNYIGIPLVGNDEFQVFSVDWQLAIFYFIHINQIELRHMKGQTIFYFLKWASLPQNERAKNVVQQYCRILEELSIQHSYQSIQEEKLLEVLYNHFLAI